MTFDVLGIGNAIVDVLTMVEEDAIAAHAITVAVKQPAAGISDTLGIDQQLVVSVGEQPAREKIGREVGRRVIVDLHGKHLPLRH